MRNVRGVKQLVSYLSEIGIPISEATIYNLLRENKIPHQRPSPRVLVFNLDVIDEWILKS